MDINTWVLYIGGGIAGIAVMIYLTFVIVNFLGTIFDDPFSPSGGETHMWFTSIITSVLVVIWVGINLINPFGIADMLSPLSKLICTALVLAIAIATLIIEAFIKY